MRSAAADLVSILYDEGISHLFVNPGMHTAPLRTALNEAEEAGVPHPQLVLCVHEQVAVSAAHGHHLAGGGPQAVMVHVDGGQPELGSALESAQRDRIPATIFWGSQPSRERAPDQPADVAGWPSPPESRQPAGKWTTDLTRGGDWNPLVRRAFQIARSEPPGLAHIALVRDRLGRQAGGAVTRRLASPRMPVPDLAALEDMAELLATAESPVIIAGRVGRHEESVHALAALAETLAAPVIDFRNHVNLPPRHPLNAATDSRHVLATADAILLLDIEVPCAPLLGPLPPQAWLLQIDVDCVKADIPGWTCPVEIAITADTCRALGPLRTMLADRLAGRRRHVQERRARVEAALGASREEWRARAASTRPEDGPDVMLAEADRALPSDAVVMVEAGAQGGAALRQLERPVGHLFHTTAGRPGWSLGAAFGASLARPAQPVVAVCDETAFVAGLPAAVFWCAHRAAAPFLTVVLDGPRRPAARRSTTRPTRRTDVSIDADSVTREAQSDVVSLARSAGAEATVVDEPAGLGVALERLLATTRDGVCAVLDARLRRP